MTDSELVRLATKRGFIIEKQGSRHLCLRKGIERLFISKGQGESFNTRNVIAVIERACRNDPKPADRLRVHQIYIGGMVRALINFEGVPKGTLGKIIADYGEGIKVEWVGLLRPIVDGFDKTRELIFLEQAAVIQ